MICSRKNPMSGSSSTISINFARSWPSARSCTCFSNIAFPQSVLSPSYSVFPYMVSRAALHHSFKHYQSEVASTIEFIQLFLNYNLLQPWNKSLEKRRSVRGTLGSQGGREEMSSHGG